MTHFIKFTHALQNALAAATSTATNHNPCSMHSVSLFFPFARHSCRIAVQRRKCRGNGEKVEINLESVYFNSFGYDFSGHLNGEQ